MSIFQLFINSFPRLMDGLWVTLSTTLISLAIAAVLGLCFGLFLISHNPILRWIAKIYVYIIRGTPIIVQAFFIYFGVPNATGIRLSAVAAGIITLSLNAGAYSAELVRGGIQSVPKGQMEAARSLGLSKTKAMTKVILPQALRLMLPSIVNQCIITLKDSSILSVIGLAELTQTGRLIIANNFESFKMWIIVGIMYMIPILILTKFSEYIERRLKIGKD